MRTALILFVGYLCIGVIALLVARYTVLTFQVKTWSWSELKQDISGDDWLMLPLAVLVWPLLALIPIISRVSSKFDAVFHGQDPHQFHCQREHLLKPVNVSEAEAGAAVADPMGRAPALPFGHLNAGWNLFLEKRQPGWTLWRFEVPGHLPTADTSSNRLWTVPRGRKVGYAWATRWKRVQLEFICECD